MRALLDTNVIISNQNMPIKYLTGRNTMSTENVFLKKRYQRLLCIPLLQNKLLLARLKL